MWRKVVDKPNYIEYREENGIDAVKIEKTPKGWEVLRQKLGSNGLIFFMTKHKTKREALDSARSWMGTKRS